MCVCGGEGFGVDHALWLKLRMGKGNNGGLFSPSVLAGLLISPFSSSMGGYYGYARGELH